MKQANTWCSDQMRAPLDSIWKSLASLEEAPAYFADCLAYWEEARNGGQMPAVSAIDPTKLPVRSLKWLAVFDVVDDGADFRVRLWGSGVAELTGGDCKGRLCSEVEGAKRAMERMGLCCRTGTPYVSGDPLSWSVGKEFVNYSVLMLPFGDGTDTATRLVSVLAFDLD